MEPVKLLRYVSFLPRYHPFTHSFNQDAYLLANLLSHPRTLPRTLPSTLRIYDEIRRPFTHDVQDRSNRNGKFFSLDPEETAFFRGKNGYRGGYVNGHGEEKENWRVLGERVWQNWQWGEYDLFFSLLSIPVNVVSV
jgi:hypothetical protein